MEKNSLKPDLSTEIVKKIKSEEIKMKPKTYFIFGSLLLGIGAAGFILVAIFFANLITFRLRVSQPQDFLWFGPSGLRPFIVNFPWQAVLLALLGIGGGLLLIRRSEFSYKKGFWLIALAILFTVGLTGLAVDRTGVNEKLCQSPAFTHLYQEQFSNHDWVIGEITQIKENRMMVIDQAGKGYTVEWGSETRFPLGSDFKTGDSIRVVGHLEGNVFMADGIGRLRCVNCLMNQPGGQRRGSPNQPCPLL